MLPAASFARTAYRLVPRATGSRTLLLVTVATA